MYCPRCGTPNTETTKFCRQCGLPLTQVTGYVASGGTGALTPPPDQASIDKGGFTPKQRMILAILLFIFAPGIMAVLTETLGLRNFGEGLTAITGIMVPLGIVWAVFRYKAQIRRLQQQQIQQQMHQPIHQAHPAFQPQAHQPPMAPTASPASLSAPPTNPISTPVRGSVTEDETQKLS